MELYCQLLYSYSQSIDTRSQRSTFFAPCCLNNCCATWAVNNNIPSARPLEQLHIRGLFVVDQWIDYVPSGVAVNAG